MLNWRKQLIVALIGLALSIAGCSRTASIPVSIPVETAPLVLPNDLGPILVLVDHLPAKGNFDAARAEQVAIGLRHFSEQTSWEYVDAAPLEKVRSAAAVVYLGLDGKDPLSSEALARLRLAHHLVVSRYHLEELRDAKIAFEHTVGGDDVAASPDTIVRYKGQTFPSALPDVLGFEVTEPARVVAGYARADAPGLPYIIQDGDALFVNGEISFDSSNVAWRGAMLTACDAITQFFSAHPLPARPQAMLRLEDVSALTPAWQLDRIVRYLAATRVPYGIGVIPDLRIKGRTIRPLSENRELLEVLRRAEQTGATTILHGLHHCCSSDSAEGYEFWDVDHNAPLAEDSAAGMRSTVAEALADLRALGVHPAIWETPHYSASPADYPVVSEFFAAAWELRRPMGWSPWVLKRDQYGAMLLPENLGYISLDGSKTVVDQLQRARELLVCQGCLAAGFIHPNTVAVGDVRKYVEGLRGLGYVFVDPAQAARRGSAPIHRLEWRPFGDRRGLKRFGIDQKDSEIAVARAVGIGWIVHVIESTHILRF